MQAIAESGAGRTFAQASPFAKLLLWLGMAAVFCALVQLAAWSFGSDLDLVTRSAAGTTILRLLALIAFRLMLSFERRPLLDFGILWPQRGNAQLATGFVAGAIVSVALMAAAVAADTFRMQGEWSSVDWPGVSFSAIEIVGLAVVQEILFRGYLQGIFVERYGSAPGVVLAALGYAVIQRVENLSAPIAIADIRIFVNLFLAACFLGLLRLWYGSIVASVGVGLGWLYAGRVIGKTQLFVPDLGSAWTFWLCPAGELRESPVLAGLLLVGIVAMARRLRAAPLQTLTRPAPVDPNLKRFMPFCVFLMMAPLDLLLAQLWLVRFRVGLIYLPRLLVTLMASTVNTVLTLPERFLLPWLLRHRRMRDPIFVVGAHRSGTTHLHYLLSLDPQFVTPRNYQVANPFGFLVTGWLLAPLMWLFFPSKRPMDAMESGLFSPQEDEFALMGACRSSPYWGMVFPREWAEHERSVFPEQMTADERRGWGQQLHRFLCRLVFWNGKRPLLKNPYHTGRAGLLRQLYPGAKFVHIYRHPYAVCRSNAHLAQETHPLFQLQDPAPETGYAARYPDLYREMVEAYYRDTGNMPRDQAVDVRYEDLDRDPLGQIERIYRELDLDMTAEYRRRLLAYLDTVKGYRKNHFGRLSIGEKALWYRKLKPLFERWGYDAELSRQDAA